MNIIHDFHDIYALDWFDANRLYYLSSGWLIGPHTREDGSTPAVKEITMHTNGHTTVWGTHLGVSRTRDANGWYQQMRAWWAAHKAARHDAKLATLKARWDARRETVRPLRADAAADMIASRHACSTTTALCDMGV